jgi:enamine deaminase RidA (YjgF/YER057c/UK114 family)
MQLSIHNIQSDSSGDFLTQLKSCLIQIAFNSGNNQANQRIVKITVFTKCIDNADYLRKMNLLIDTLSQSERYDAPVSLACQPPINCEMMMEIWTFDYPITKPSFFFTQDKQSAVLHIDCPEFSCLFSTQYSADQETFKENTQETFRQLDASLHANGFNYHDIVRQWNYIENIIHLDAGTDKSFQNYQIFNDLRSVYYGKSDFTKGYPSATGIGTECGGLMIEAIAFKEKKSNTIKPVTNSYQVDAHSYSSNVLIGNAIEEIKRISTPKFERGKYLQFGKEGFLFISGTASIIGEKTVYKDDVSKQTLTTLKNIDHLVSTNNLDNNNISATSHLRLLNYRVYLKNESDYAIVKSLCDDHYGTNMGFIVKADICRNNLLVEIEANYLV